MKVIDKWLKAIKDHEDDFILYFLRRTEILVKVEWTKSEMIVYSKFHGYETLGRTYIGFEKWLKFYSEISVKGYIDELEDYKRKLRIKNGEV